MQVAGIRCNPVLLTAIHLILYRIALQNIVKIIQNTSVEKYRRTQVRKIRPVFIRGIVLPDNAVKKTVIFQPSGGKPVIPQ